MSANCSLFDLNHPPLLKTCGFGFISTHRVGPQNVESFDFELDPKLFFPTSEAAEKLQGIKLANDAPPVKGKLTRTRFWQMTEPPMRLVNTQKIVKTLIFKSSVTQLESLKAAVSATVGGNFGPFSAEVKASIEAGLETEKTFSVESIEERETTLDGGKAYAFWELTESIEMTFELYLTSIPAGRIMLPFAWQPNPIGGTTVIGIFQDEAAFDELPA